MSASLRILALSALLTAGVTMDVRIAKAADIPIEGAASRAVHYRSGWAWREHAPSELIEGVRGATPLTVPFVGYGWYPGPAHYYGPLHRPCCLAGAPVVSVKY